MIRSVSEAATQTPAPARKDKTGRDMLLSLAVLVIPILILGGLLRACGSAEPTVIDPTSAIADARAAGMFPVVVAQGLGSDWQAVQATFRRVDDGTGMLRLGYLAPGGGQALLIQSNEEAGVLLERELGKDVRPQGQVMVRGQEWTSSLVRGDEHALVLTETVRTIIVVGRAPLDELTTLAASLR
jgi:hypothetical protein